MPPHKQRPHRQVIPALLHHLFFLPLLDPLIIALHPIRLIRKLDLLFELRILIRFSYMVMLFKITNPSPNEISNERVTFIPYGHTKGDVQLLSRFIGSDYEPCHYFWDAWDGMPCGALVGVFDLAHGLEITNGY
jgi:hypothetical protein